MFGFIVHGEWAVAQTAWQWEQIRAVVRDTLYRRADTLPVAYHEATPEIMAASLAVTASYSESVERIASTQSGAQGNGLQHTSQPDHEPVNYHVVDPPDSYSLSGFRHVYQTPNNCGPATLAVMLSYFGWQGDQADIASVLKPHLRDKNVRWDEMVYYVRNHAGWLDALFRVGGDFDMLETFIANGYPIIIETGYEVETGWVGHYLLATGYDRPSRSLTVQDVTGGPSRELTYEQVDSTWRQFNRLYILVFPASERDKIEFMLAEDAMPDGNRQRALRQTKADTEAAPHDAFAWFAHASNLTYFDRYREASSAYDRARESGLPWRMMFYQFGPYIAYFNVGRYQDVVDLATATLQARPDLEESYVWRGWARHMLGQRRAAIADFRAALRVNPNFLDAIQALQTLDED